jgi:hypothetical protein
MRHSDILSPYQGTITHPYVASIAIDPSELAKFQRLSAEQSDVVNLGVDYRTRDRCTIYAACASKTGRDLLESNW